MASDERSDGHAHPNWAARRGKTPLDATVRQCPLTGNYPMSASGARQSEVLAFWAGLDGGLILVALAGLNRFNEAAAAAPC